MAVPFSCKTRVCPSCRAEVLSHSLAEKLPEGDYRHLVVTLPKKMGLRKRFQLDTRLHRQIGRLIHRVLTRWMMRKVLVVFAIVTGLVLTAPAGAQEAAQPPRVLFTNVHVFYGVNEKRIENANVLAAKQGKFLAKLKKWYTPHEALKMTTHDNAQLLALSGPRNPYPGELGVVKEGALADLILVDGNPLENLDLVAEVSFQEFFRRAPAASLTTATDRESSRAPR